MAGDEAEIGAERTRTALRVLADEHRALGEWKPEQASVRDELVQALKAAAAAVKNWEALDDAVEQEISDQRDLTEWWFGVPNDAEKPRHVRGRGNPSIRADRGELEISEPDAEEFSGIPHQKVGRWRKALRGDVDDYRDLLRGPSWRKAMLERGSTDQRGASGTGENEWHTPAESIERVRAVLEVIDLDPASSAAAQQTVRAEKFYTKQDNGLAYEWRGRVFVNPPYAQPLIEQFVRKLCAERRAGHVTAAILLTHNYTDTAWFQEIASLADAICFTRGRVKFYDPIRNKIANPTQGQAFSYFGDDVLAFASAFSEIGFVLVPWRS
jgi:phage N-6-adenine-methyltransferase